MLDPLQRIERQLVDAAARLEPGPRPTRRRRTWRAPQIALAALSALVLATAASAVTGVGPAGGLFEAEEIGLAPSPGGASVTASQVTPTGGRAAMRAYEDKDGALCIQSPPVTGAPAGGVAVSCAPRAEVARTLERDRVFASVGESASGAPVLFGVVSGDVGELAVGDGEGGSRSPAELSEAWSNATGPGGSVKAFVATLAPPVPDIQHPATLYADGGERLGGWPPPEPVE